MKEQLYYGTVLEEELKNKVAREWFAAYDTTRILGKIDFAVALPHPKGKGKKGAAADGGGDPAEYLLWAEAKAGRRDPIASLIQLILTIGRARACETLLPPAWLGAFDADGIAFVPFHRVMEVFGQTDFNWNVPPSDHTTREFRRLQDLLGGQVRRSLIVFGYGGDGEELRAFLRGAFREGAERGEGGGVQVTVNNFTHVYNRWRAAVRPTIATDWERAKAAGIIDADFFLADLLSRDNATLKEKLFVVLRGGRYVLDRKIDDLGMLSSKETEFTDGQRAHAAFWRRYARPPRREWWDRMVERRDLLVPQDVRERKGSFFTPPQWVELSQEYLARELGGDWQERYYVWDCCAGTGNLLAGLTNKYRVFASTLDRADVEVMRDRIDTMERTGRAGRGGSNLLPAHVFQFDFLNDPFLLDRPEESKLPKDLIAILKDPKKRQKLVIYINPPYAEASNARTPSNTGKNRKGLSTTKVLEKYGRELGRAGNELFAQFFIRIYKEIPGCVLAEFSTLKILQGPNFADFRKNFQAKMRRCFVVPANTFDNVKGEFPIGFLIWKLGEKEIFTEAAGDCYGADSSFLLKKRFYAVEKTSVINSWLHKHFDLSNKRVAVLRFVPSNFQNNSGVYLVLKPKDSDIRESRVTYVTAHNLRVIAIYIAVRNCIGKTWLNNQENFLSPNDEWEDDLEFQGDCLAYTLFSDKNRISCAAGANHWIPFTEEEVGAQGSFASHFMAGYLRQGGPDGGEEDGTPGGLFADEERAERAARRGPAVFGTEARAVMDAGRALWRHYHAQPGTRPDAALYDIRLHFQGTDARGRMNTASPDGTYTALRAALRQNLKTLAAKIAPKVYEYGFLRK